MTGLEKLMYLNKKLINEMPRYMSDAEKFPHSYGEQRRLLRSLMNVRPPMPIDEQFLIIQDEILSEEVKAKGTIGVSDLKASKVNPQIYLWQGDITTLEVDAIVNAANSALLGCFIPCHACIDNAIHSVAGLQLRQACDEIMKMQGHAEEVGVAKITRGYNLPSKFVIHTVGPIIEGRLTKKDCDLLASCYRHCLKLAIAQNLKNIAFCCISTGEFHFPNDRAAEIAVNTVSEVLKEDKSEIEVIFNVFKEKDYALYRELLEED